MRSNPFQLDIVNQEVRFLFSESDQMSMPEVISRLCHLLLSPGMVIRVLRPPMNRGLQTCDQSDTVTVPRPPSFGKMQKLLDGLRQPCRATRLADSRGKLEHATIHPSCRCFGHSLTTLFVVSTTYECVALLLCEIGAKKRLSRPTSCCLESGGRDVP